MGICSYDESVLQGLCSPSPSGDNVLTVVKRFNDFTKFTMTVIVMS